MLVKGKPYGSIKEAERALGVASGSVSYWISKKPEVAKKITKEEYFNLLDKAG